MTKLRPAVALFLPQFNRYVRDAMEEPMTDRDKAIEIRELMVAFRMPDESVLPPEIQAFLRRVESEVRGE